jgi:hypothetical protein
MPNLSEPRPYHALRSIAEELGGSMRHEKQGMPQGGAWLVEIPGHSVKSFESNGAGFPPLDRLYVPKRPDPTHYRDYTCELLPGARERWIAMLEAR